MTYAELIALLVQLRQAQGLTQAEVARRRGVTPGTQNHHEKGIRTVDHEGLGGWARALGHDVEIVTNEERELLAQWRRLSPTQRHAVSAVVGEMPTSEK